MSAQEHPRFPGVEGKVLGGAPTKEVTFLMMMLIRQMQSPLSLNMNTRAVRAPFLVGQLVPIRPLLVEVVGTSSVTTAPEW